MRYVLGLYESVYTENCYRWYGEWCGFRRMPKGLFLPSLNLRNFGVLLFYLFIVHSTSFFMHSACEHSTKRNTKNRFRWDLSLNIFQRVEHKPINVLFSMYSTHSSLDFACWERERKQRKKTQREASAARKNRIKCFLAMKIYSKSLWDLFRCAKYQPRIAISTYRLHRCEYTHHLISVMRKFSIYILNKMKIDVAEGKKMKIFIKLHQKPINFYLKWHFAIYRRHGIRRKNQTGRMACVAFVLSCRHVGDFYCILSPGCFTVKNPIRYGKINCSASSQSHSNASCVCDWHTNSLSLSLFIYRPTFYNSAFCVNNTQLAATRTDPICGA